MATNKIALNMRNIESIMPSNKLMELHRIAFETMGYELLNMNSDINNFSIQIIRNQNNRQKSNQIEPLIFGALETLSRLISNTKDFQKSNSYFFNLLQKGQYSNSITIEVDYLSTHNDIIYLEAYCYDETEKLVGKGGYMLMVNSEH
jgi:hypothetical protein